MYYNECPLCGANLDPGEPCDCQEEKKSKKKLQLKNQSEHRNRALQLCAETGYQIWMIFLRLMISKMNSSG